MAVILDLQQQRRRLVAKRGFESWTRRFSDSFDEQTCVVDLSDTALRTLIQHEEGPSLLIYGLIMGFLGLGKGTTFFELESRVRLEVMDTSLFLLDQLRFEVMRRLGWIEPSPFCLVPLLDLVERFSTVYSGMKHQTPRLHQSHPRYPEYQEVFEEDRGGFVRKLIPDAIQAFQEQEEGA
jgi:hypothetical protein